MILDSGISAVVTGGASSPGAATSRLLVRSSVIIAIFDKNIENGEAVALRESNPLDDVTVFERFRTQMPLILKTGGIKKNEQN
ncbi:hypothetical protein [Hyphomonas sp.]|uniref:hypothetical protein n=1 Tax=Hyphomonas sp. TaxID=87 RepID=UPI003D2A24B6